VIDSAFAEGIMTLDRQRAENIKDDIFRIKLSYAYLKIFLISLLLLISSRTLRLKGSYLLGKLAFYAGNC